MEMNTRLQVEHPVTELVTGIDLVEWQVRVAAGERLPFTQEDIRLTGHAIEARVYAEDPGREFLPTGGQVLDLIESAGPGIRVDSGLRTGTVVGSDYDPMLSKVIVHAATREQAVAGLDRALAQTSVLGVQTNIAFLRRLLADDDVRQAHLDTSLLDRIAAEYQPNDAPDAAFLAAAAHAWLARWRDADPGDLWRRPDGWRVGDRAPSRFRLHCGNRTTEVTLAGEPEAATATLDNGAAHHLECAPAQPGHRADDRRPPPHLPGSDSDSGRRRHSMGTCRRRDLPHTASAGRTTPNGRRPGRRRRDHQPDARVGGGRARRKTARTRSVVRR